MHFEVVRAIVAWFKVAAAQSTELVQMNVVVQVGDMSTGLACVQCSGRDRTSRDHSYSTYHQDVGQTDPGYPTAMMTRVT